MTFLKTSVSKILTLILLSFSSNLSIAQEIKLGPTFFSENVINAILSQKEATGIRIYNVVKDQNSTTQTTMMVGIKNDGSEINGAEASQKYQVNDGVSGREGLSHGISRSNAVELCGATQNSFSATFSAASVQELIKESDANGIEVKLSNAGSDPTFEISSANLSEGVWLVNSNINSSKDDRPCPSFCDEDKSHYVNR